MWVYLLSLQASLLWSICAVAASMALLSRASVEDIHPLPLRTDFMWPLLLSYMKRLVWVSVLAFMLFLAFFVVVFFIFELFPHSQHFHYFEKKGGWKPTYPNLHSVSSTASLEQSHTAQCRTYNKGIVCLRSVTPAPLLGQVMIYQGLNLPLVIMEDLQPSAAGASVLPCIFVCLCGCACICARRCRQGHFSHLLSNPLAVPSLCILVTLPSFLQHMFSFSVCLWF